MNQCSYFRLKIALRLSAVYYEVLGDHKSIRDIAATSKKNPYDIQPKLEHLATLDELKAKMLDMQAKTPADVFSYMSL